MARVLPRLVVDLCGHFNDLTCNVSTLVRFSHQDDCPILHQHIGEILSDI